MAEYLGLPLQPTRHLYGKVDGMSHTLWEDALTGVLDMEWLLSIGKAVKSS
jgi:hypothetical protein